MGYLLRVRCGIALLFCLSVVVPIPAPAGKPAPAPATYGKIHFACASAAYVSGGEDLLHEMNPDGGGKVRSSFIPSVNDVGDVFPSAKTYGTDQHRLWLMTEGHPTLSQVSQVYVTRDGLNLTLVRSGSDVTDPETGLRRVVSYGGVQWSNDAQDSFFSVIATCRVIDTLQRKLLSLETLVCRCDVSGQYLDSLQKTSSR